MKPNLLNHVIYRKTMDQIGQVLRKNRGKKLDEILAVFSRKYLKQKMKFLLLLLFSADYETVIKRELLLNGPLVACFVVYDEFQHYVSGK